ncbi:MAG: apolipoprotein N-acyltransferase [Verrucomicrobiales bacterium]|jgi:apolipoprotein N-acyltransferase|nr:apolipoprotein N-acyltransferase [Verrucomicrobiales bacterium]
MRTFLTILSGAASGLLLTLGFAPFDQAWAGWIFLVPLALTVMLRCRSWRGSLAAGYVFGVTHFATSLFWLTNASVLGWAALTLYLGLYFAVWTWLWWWLTATLTVMTNSARNFSLIIGGASAWVLLEWLRGTLFTGFPWNQLGVTQHGVIGLIQSAEFGGVLLISWLVTLGNLALTLLTLRLWKEIRLRQMARARWEFTLSLAIIGVTFALGVRGLFKKPEYVNTLRYLAVQPNFPNDPWAPGATVSEALAKMHVLSVSGLSPAPADVDLVIWPETPVGGALYANPGFPTVLRALTEQRPVAWLLGSNWHTVSDIYNSALLYNAGQSSPDMYFKNHLVPFGEYTPLKKIFPWILKLTPVGIDFSAGTDAVPLTLTAPRLKIAPLICFEDTLARQARKAARHNPNLFINLTNDGWFKDSAASAQHLHNAIFRAVENRLPLLRVTNSGVTVEISERGVVRKVLRDAAGHTFTTGVMFGELPIPLSRETLYQRHGDWIVGMSAMLFLLISVEKVIRNGLDTKLLTSEERNKNK